ncbi:MAG: hypothetical protein WC003_16750 [Terrimicrobiaceae bacterium]|nr:hypothetical protein [Terrimicrobiaceae bacterium]
MLNKTTCGHIRPTPIMGLFAGAIVILSLIIVGCFASSGNIITKQALPGKYNEDFVAVRKIPIHLFPPFNSSGYFYRVEYWKSPRVLGTCALVDAPKADNTVTIQQGNDGRCTVFFDDREVGFFFSNGVWHEKNKE